MNRDDIRKINEQPDEANNDVVVARKKLLKDEIDGIDFKTIHADVEKRVRLPKAQRVEKSKQLESIHRRFEVGGNYSAKTGTFLPGR
ncbi:hypothetical protein [Chitinophaga sp.]|uniref:hypothetical protein n=1 Tax=Chitinophaga sp. TaxID=1869181 RepID=UPI002C19BF58|nr:hypothetical protein [Chitinophaga sp.]HWV64728.1 hypothetical protein [Chitinophaga sp.]